MKAAPTGWRLDDARLFRVIEGDHSFAVPVEESVLRFPSAPDLTEAHMASRQATYGQDDAYHSYRILRPVADLGSPVRRIFLLQGGINELSSMEFYYRLASELFAQQPDTACIVRPFPEHLTRMSSSAFAATPLDGYLADSAHLFRQFLRYMIETQWLMSTLARRSIYHSPSGLGLLADSPVPSKSHIDANRLARAIAAAWHSMQQSLDASRGPSHNALGSRDVSPRIDAIRECITSLRNLLRLDVGYPGQDGVLHEHDAGDPAIHVVGYSMGGFTAQAILMAWPYLISSCTVLLSGGALRGFVKDTFVHPEEWQTVIHSLSYDVTRELRRYINNASGVAESADEELITALARVFRHTFVGQSTSATQSWLRANRKRLLFVVGGNDPILRSDTVLDASPPGGINLIEIAGMGHFPGELAKNKDEDDQRTFWLPEITALLSRFADRVAQQHVADQRTLWLDQGYEDRPGRNETRLRMDRPRRMSISELQEIRQDGALDAEQFERCLDDLVAREGGYLFALSNDIPDVMRTAMATRRYAAALHHDQVSIMRHCESVSRRATAIWERADNIWFIVPHWLLGQSARRGAHIDMLSQSETIGHHNVSRWDIASEEERALRTLNKLIRRKDADFVRVFDPSENVADEDGLEVTKRLLAHASEFTGREEVMRVSSLPECWLWVSREFMNFGIRSLTATQAIEELAVAVVERGAAYDRWYDDVSRGQLAVVDVSRAKYNPRYRGRLVRDPHDIRRMLLHTAICAVLSSRLRDWRDLDDEYHKS